MIISFCCEIEELFQIWFWIRIEIVNAVLERRIYLINFSDPWWKAQGCLFPWNSTSSKMHLRWKIIYLILIKYFDAIGFSFGHENEIPVFATQLWDSKRYTQENKRYRLDSQCKSIPSIRPFSKHIPKSIKLGIYLCKV